MKPTLIIGDSHVHYLQSLRKSCANIYLLGVVGRTMYAIDKFKKQAMNLLVKRKIHNIIILMGTNDLSGLLLYYKHCPAQTHTRRYSQALVKHTLQQSIDRCVHFCKECTTKRPQTNVFLCNVFKEHHRPDILMWNTYHFVLQAKCSRSRLAQKRHRAFQDEVYQHPETDTYLRIHSYYNHPFFRQQITVHDQTFVETFVHHYTQRRRWFNTHLQKNCALNGYTFVNLSQYIEEWGKQECAMYQTAFNRVLRKESPYDMHYVSELMAIALLRALATDTTTLLSWQTVKRLTKRLHRQYMSHGKTIKRRRCTL